MVSADGVNADGYGEQSSASSLRDVLGLVLTERKTQLTPQFRSVLGHSEGLLL